MEDRVSSAIYNPHNDYDITTVVGNQRLADAAQMDPRAYRSRSEFGNQVRLFVFQLGIFALIGIGFTVFG